MKIAQVCIVLLLLAGAACGEHPIKHSPVIDPALELEWWKASANAKGAELALMRSAQMAALNRAQLAQQQVEEKLSAACGEGFQPAARDNKLACVEKPKPAPVPAGPTGK